MSSPRKVTAAVLVALATTIAIPATSQAATIKACQNKKNGKLRVAKKCKKSEKKITWNTAGPKGDNGADGSNGTNGAPGANGTSGTNGINGVPGQPQTMRRFSATQAGNSTADNNVALFQADGVSYSFDCVFALIVNGAGLYANGTGTAYSQGTLARPSGTSRQADDPWSSTRFTTLSASNQLIADHTTLSQVDGNSSQNGVYTTAVEGPTSTTLLHFKMVAAGSCTIQGVALTVPNAA